MRVTVTVTIAYRNSFSVPKRIFFYWKSSDTVTISYCDTFATSHLCHCDQSSQYLSCQADTRDALYSILVVFGITSTCSHDIFHDRSSPSTVERADIVATARGRVHELRLPPQDGRSTKGEKGKHKSSSFSSSNHVATYCLLGLSFLVMLFSKWH